MGAVTPHLGGGSFRYDPLPAKLVARRRRLRLVYHDGSGLQALSLGPGEAAGLSRLGRRAGALPLHRLQRPALVAVQSALGFASHRRLRWLSPSPGAAIRRLPARVRSVAPRGRGEPALAQRFERLHRRPVLALDPAAVAQEACPAP